MKVEQLLKEEEIKNPLGSPPRGLPQLLDFFDTVESNFIGALYQKTNVSAREYTQGIADFKGLGKTTTVNINQLIPIEKKVSKSHVEDILHDRERKQSSQKPIVYLYKQKMYLVDGNHRVAAAFLNKEKSIQVNLVDIDHVQNFTKKLNAQT